MIFHILLFMYLFNYQRSPAARGCHRGFSWTRRTQKRWETKCRPERFFPEAICWWQQMTRILDDRWNWTTFCSTQETFLSWAFPAFESLQRGFPTGNQISEPHVIESQGRFWCRVAVTIPQQRPGFSWATCPFFHQPSTRAAILAECRQWLF